MCNTTYIIRSCRGFTLVEVLIASMLLSIVMTAIYTLFFTTIGAWNAVDIDYDMPRAARNVTDIMRSDYDNLIFEAGHLFEGEGDRVTMFTVVHPLDMEKPEGRHLMRVRYAYNRSRKTLTREEALVDAPLPNRPPGPTEVDMTRVEVKDETRMVIASDVRKFDLRYIWTPDAGSGSDNEPPTRVRHFFARRHYLKWGLPQGLQVTLEMGNPEKKKPNFSTIVQFPTRTKSEHFRGDELEKRLGGVL